MTFRSAPDGRKARLGASELSAIVLDEDGRPISPWDTPWETWAKRHAPEFPEVEDNPAMRRGRAMEPVLVDFAEAELRLPVDRSFAAYDGPWIVNDRWPSLGAHPDGTARGVVVEAKAPMRADGWGAEGTADLPLHYLLQVQAQAAIVGVDEWIVVADIWAEFRVYRGGVDGSIFDVLDGAEEWARKHIVEAAEPPIDTSTAAMRVKFPRVSAPLRPADDYDIRAALDYIEARDSAKAAEADKEAAAAALQLRIGEAEGFSWGRSVATWKAAKPSLRLDMDRLLAERPDLAPIIESYRVPIQSSRRLDVRIKE